MLIFPFLWFSLKFWRVWLWSICPSKQETDKHKTKVNKMNQFPSLFIAKSLLRWRNPNRQTITQSVCFPSLQFEYALIAQIGCRLFQYCAKCKVSHGKHVSPSAGEPFKYTSNIIASEPNLSSIFSPSCVTKKLQFKNKIKMSYHIETDIVSHATHGCILPS